MRIAIAILGAYLLGSIPTGWIVSKLKFGRDVREGGSGATGATNVARQFGLGWAIFVTIIDIAKGISAVLLTKALFPEIEWLYGVAGIAAIIGHCYPVWIGFRGGKGVNTALGIAVVISPVAIVFGLAAFGAAFAISRFVSVGSISAVLVYSLSILLFGSKFGAVGQGQLIFAGILPILIIWTHRANIRRLIRGEEFKPVSDRK
ncbi:MAG: glycerol-3-phosphate 1-O-acyltransferase PlsY [bacterium]